MTRPQPLDKGYPMLARLIGIEITTWPQRIARAHEVMADARSPLRANSYEATLNGGNGPDPGQTAIAQQATRERRELDATINAIDGLVRHAGKILNEWAPHPTKTGLALWCENHLRHGHHEIRAGDGSANCRWCCDVHRAYGTWPTRQLLELHARGRRIGEAEYRRLLGKGAA
jgi:hypothetical protein